MRRVELGGGIAAGILSVIGLLVLLFGPLVSYCGYRVNDLSQCSDIRYTSLAHAGMTPGIWGITFGMLAFILAAAAGAIGESRFGLRNGAVVLWAGGALVLFGCVLTAGTIGLFYLPALLALGLATYASILRRMDERHPASSVSATGQSSTGS